MMEFGAAQIFRPRGERFSFRVSQQLLCMRLLGSRILHRTKVSEQTCNRASDRGGTGNR